MTTFLLTEEERQQVENLTQDAHRLTAKRARLILLYAEGLPTRIASQQAGFSSSQARHWKQLFSTHRLGIFKTHPGEEVQEANQEPQLPASPEPRLRPEKPGILPDDLMSQAGCKILQAQFQEMTGHETGTISGEDIEELHDMRVATRRMRAAIDVFEAYYPPKTIKPLLQGLRATGRTLGAVRDLDVSIEKIDAYVAGLPSAASRGMAPLQDHWKNLLIEARQRLLDFLGSQDYLDFKTNFESFLYIPDNSNRKPKPASLPQATVRYLAPTLIYTRMARVMAFDAIIPTATYNQLHALRIEFKKFRYALEFFGEVLGSESQAIVEEIKQLQDHLGELNDANVACGVINRLLKHWDENQAALPLVERTSPEAVVNYLAAQYTVRHQLMISFPNSWQNFTRPELRQNLAKAIAAL